jgi:hypothetical protein
MMKTGEDGQFKVLYTSHFSLDFRPDRLKRLLSTKAISCRTVVDGLDGRLFPVKKTKGYSQLGKSEKNERFSQRRRLSQNTHQTTGFDL